MNNKNNQQKKTVKTPKENQKNCPEIKSENKQDNK